MKRQPTFKVDNQMMQQAPFIFGPTYKTSRLQLWLPGLEPPFSTFDRWATMALYSLLDPKNPSAAVRVKPTELLQVLGFARVVAKAVNEGAPYEFQTFQKQDYRLIEESLHRLYTVEVRTSSFWKVKLPGQRGHPKKQWVEFKGRILQSYAYIYAPGVTPPSSLPLKDRHKIQNVNTATTAAGEAGAPIWKYKDGPKPVAIEYRLASDLVRGLTGDDPNIGATILPFKIFSLRKDFQKSATATDLLAWVCRQLNPQMKRSFDGLTAELNTDPDRPGRSREAIAKGFKLLKAAGVIDDFTVTGQDVTFQKNRDWPYASDSEDDLIPQLGAPKAKA